jgi:hypothetical protein
MSSQYGIILAGAVMETKGNIRSNEDRLAGRHWQAYSGDFSPHVEGRIKYLEERLEGQRAFLALLEGARREQQRQD